ncbi:unnamed protein product [Cylicocyclus nassatus]|uniref:Uncharacterized protein n=1 Tax=Cylicocyclus nassatus TaxID=53992 RepID=A0AA36H347_CYLNA|nr:unnamed protein product [Cylicocyclus nassatus]
MTRTNCYQWVSQGNVWNEKCMNRRGRPHGQWVAKVECADFQPDKQRHVVHVRILVVAGEGKRGRRGDGDGESTPSPATSEESLIEARSPSRSPSPKLLRTPSMKKKRAPLQGQFVTTYLKSLPDNVAVGKMSLTNTLLEPVQYVDRLEDGT